MEPHIVSYEEWLAARKAKRNDEYDISPQSCCHTAKNASKSA